MGGGSIFCAFLAGDGEDGARRRDGRRIVLILVLLGFLCSLAPLEKVHADTRLLILRRKFFYKQEEPSY